MNSEHNLNLEMDISSMSTTIWESHDLYLSEGLVSIGIKSGDGGDTFKDGGCFLPCWGQSLTVAAPGSKELHQHDPVRV